ncbi:MAG: cupin domain-containing protein [Candidatus Micrarchaeia archaeon]|jgi:mannose-6-phosphate isomerase-like protein (cupin superfamily)
MAKKGYVIAIESKTQTNSDFRRVLYTGKTSQLVLMSLRPKEEIGSEVHPNIDQFLRFEHGEGVVVIDGVSHRVKGGYAVIVPAGAEHNVINTSDKSDLRLYTIYSPPEHIDRTQRKTKADAIAKPEEFDGKTSE